MRKLSYRVKGWIKHAALDSYTEGELDGGHSSSGRDHFEADTIQNLLNQLQNFFGCAHYEPNSCDEDGRIDFSRYEDDHGEEASSQQLKDWRAGAINLWSATYTVQVERIESTIERIREGATA